MNLLASVLLLALPQSHEAPRTVAILVYDGVELLDFAGPGEVFSAAHGSDGRAFRVVTVGKTKATVRSQGFVDVVPQHALADCPRPDVLVLPGGSVPDDEEIVEWVRGTARSAELVMSVCNGAYLAARAGLLDGLEATTHHGSLQGLTEAFPRTRVLVNRRFVDSGRVMTCAGVSAGIDGSLHVVERMLGADSARRVARYMEYDWRPAEIAAQHAQPGRTIAEGPTAELAAIALDAGVDAALAALRALPSQPEESELIATGLALLAGDDGARGRALLALTTAAFPTSARACDSLAEACERLGDTAGALESTERALALVPLDAALSPSRGEMLRNVLDSRRARLGRGDASALRFACAPCGAPCDEPRYVRAGTCPRCHAPLIEQAQ